MTEANYKFLVNTMKNDMKTIKSLIETFKNDAERDKEKGWSYGEGLNKGWMFALEYRLKNIEGTLKAIGEVKGDEPQRTSAKPVA